MVIAILCDTFLGATAREFSTLLEVTEIVKIYVNAKST